MRLARTCQRQIGALCLALSVTVPAAAANLEPTRVGRVADLRGTVWAYDIDEQEWVSVWRNRPVVEGDRLAVADDGRAELRIGSTALRLGAGSELEVLVLDDARMVFELHRGALAWRLRSAEHVRQAELRLAEGGVRPLEPGHYRIDRGQDSDGPAHVGVWRGRLEVVGGGNLLHLDAGDRVALILDPRRGIVTTRAARMPDDELSAWARSADASTTVDAYRYVSPDLTGAEDLDRHGRWDRHPEFGAVWVPTVVPPGWEPFRDGRWVWLRPWGWTWVDAAPWGFAPFHYGRWVRWDLRWVWWPGPRGVVPVFQPALVAWIGGPELSFGITIGAGVRPPPPVAWVPLAPHQHYVPRVRPPPRHVGPPRHALPPLPRDARPPRYVVPVPPPRTRRDVDGPRDGRDRGGHQDRWQRPGRHDRDDRDDRDDRGDRGDRDSRGSGDDRGGRGGPVDGRDRSDRRDWVTHSAPFVGSGRGDREDRGDRAGRGGPDDGADPGRRGGPQGPGSPRGDEPRNALPVPPPPAGGDRDGDRGRSRDRDEKRDRGAERSPPASPRVAPALPPRPSLPQGGSAGVRVPPAAASVVTSTRPFLTGGAGPRPSLAADDRRRQGHPPRHGSERPSAEPALDRAPRAPDTEDDRRGGRGARPAPVHSPAAERAKERAKERAEERAEERAKERAEARPERTVPERPAGRRVSERER